MLRVPDSQMHTKRNIRPSGIQAVTTIQCKIRVAGEVAPIASLESYFISIIGFKIKTVERPILPEIVFEGSLIGVCSLANKSVGIDIENVPVT